MEKLLGLDRAQVRRARMTKTDLMRLVVVNRTPPGASKARHVPRWKYDDDDLLFQAVVHGNPHSWRLLHNNGDYGSHIGRVDIVKDS